MSTLVVAALHDEVIAFGSHVFDEILVTGPGKLNAAIQLTARFDSVYPRPSRVLNVGTAGDLRHGKHEGSVVNPIKFVQHDFDSKAILTLTGIQFSTERRTVEVLNLPRVTCATGDVFVQSGDHAALLRARHGADIVDMEAYVYATVCASYGIPFGCLKYVTDGANSDSLVTWKESVHSASEILKKYALEATGG